MTNTNMITAKHFLKQWYKDENCYILEMFIAAEDLTTRMNGPSWSGLKVDGISLKVPAGMSSNCITTYPDLKMISVAASMIVGQTCTI